MNKTYVIYAYDDEDANYVSSGMTKEPAITFAKHITSGKEENIDMPGHGTSVVVIVPDHIDDFSQAMKEDYAIVVHGECVARKDALQAMSDTEQPE